MFLTLVSCASENTSNYLHVNTTNLAELESVRYTPSSPSSSAQATSISDLRVKSLQDSAMSIGAQAGLAWASERMNAQLQYDTNNLDTIYNFNAMVLSHGVMPPVLEEGNFSLNLHDPDTIRVADKTYRIIKQAYFATTPPNWRDYLWLAYSKPELPNRTLLPKNEREQNVWRNCIRRGWEKGIQQAYSIFQQNLARLKRDFRGMLLYRKLLQRQMISPPFVARTELGITGDGTDMRINDQVLRIVEHPQLQTSGKNWHAIVVKR